jgi:hypothetical protein
MIGSPYLTLDQLKGAILFLEGRPLRDVAVSFFYFPQKPNLLTLCVRGCRGGRGAL